VPRIIDPSLQARVVRQFNLLGELAPFELTQTVVPTFDIGALTGQTRDPTEVVTPGENQSLLVGLLSNNSTFQTGLPNFSSSEVVPDTQNAIAADTVLADSGQLSPGDYFIDCNISHDDGTTIDVAIEWRNAANNANILEIPFFMGLRAGKLFRFRTIATDERFRLITHTAIAATIHSYMAVTRSDNANAF